MKTRTGSNSKRLIYDNMGKKSKRLLRISLVRLRFDTLGPVLYRCLQDIEVPIKATLLLHIKKIALSLG